MSDQSAGQMSKHDNMSIHNLNDMMAESKVNSSDFNRRTPPPNAQLESLTPSPSKKKKKKSPVDPSRDNNDDDDVHSFRLVEDDESDGVDSAATSPAQLMSGSFNKLRSIDSNDSSDIMSRRTGSVPPTVQTSNFNTSSSRKPPLSPNKSLSDVLDIPTNRRMYVRQGSKDDTATICATTTAKASQPRTSPKHQTYEIPKFKSPTSTTETEAISPAVKQSPGSRNVKSLQRQPSQDDMVIVKCDHPNFIHKVLNIHPINAIKEVFPSFNVFKSNVEKRKSDLFEKHMIDSEVLYELLDRLSWSFSFQQERRKLLTQRFLRADGKSYTRDVIQSIIQEDFNISIGDYECDTLLRYAAMYVDHFHESNSVRLFDDAEKDKVEREGYGQQDYYYEKNDLPFSLLLPHNVKKSKWLNCIDRLAIRQLNEATNREAANMTRMAGIKNHKNNRVSVLSSRKISMMVSGDSPGSSRRISKLEIREYRAMVKKRRPKRKLFNHGGFQLDVSVFKATPASAPKTRQERITSFAGATYTSFSGRVFGVGEEGQIVPMGEDNSHEEEDDDSD